jgi:hypothetical protein
MHKDFWPKLTLEKPTRGKPVIEGFFIILELKEIFCYKINLSSTKIIDFFRKLCQGSSSEYEPHTPRNSCPEIIEILEISAHKIDLYDP